MFDIYIATVHKVHLTAGEIARMIDGGTVEHEVEGGTLEITGDVPDWGAKS